MHAWQVVISTGDDLEALMQSSDKPLFIEFYAPWCGYCKKAKPDVIALAETAESFTVVTVDATLPATEVMSTSEPFGIQSFPAFFLHRNGSAPEAYTGHADLASMRMWVQKRLLPVVTVASTMDDVFPSWLGAADPVCVIMCAATARERERDRQSERECVCADGWTYLSHLTMHCWHV